MEKLKVEYIPTGELVTYENNAKIHTGEQIEQIKKSIEEFGFNDPIAVWKDNVIIEGHGRMIAAKELGIETVPVIRLDSLTDEQRKAYMLVHNKLTMNTDFDMLMLEEELEKMDNIDMSQFGFDMTFEELSSFFEEKPELPAPEIKEEEIDEKYLKVKCMYPRELKILTMFLEKQGIMYEMMDKDV